MSVLGVVTRGPRTEFTKTRGERDRNGMNRLLHHAGQTLMSRETSLLVNLVQVLDGGKRVCMSSYWNNILSPIYTIETFQAVVGK